MRSIPELEWLQMAVKGDVIHPSDHGYEQLNRSFYGEFKSRQPLAVVRVADASDVAIVIRLVQERGLALAVRAGGHSVLGHSSSDGGVVLDLSGLGSFDLDLPTRSAWAGGGMLAGEYTARAAEYGFVTGFGDTGSVGISGITLGGGVGFLHRKLGLTIDSLLAAEIVTADGEVRMLDEKEDPDLFWAVRGGGGNFGVVTRLRYRLHPVDTVVGGMLIMPATAKTITDFVAMAREASDELSAVAGVMVAPPLPFLPEQVHGQLVLMAMMVHAGEVGAGEEETGRFRRLADPLADSIQIMPYTGMFPPEGAGPPNPEAMSVRSFFSDHFTTEHAEAVIDALHESTAAMSVTQLRVLGGQVARVPVDATAFAHRDRAMIINVAAAYENVGERSVHDSWVLSLSTQLRNGHPGAYVNFLGDDAPESVREAYPGPTWDRLVEVKSKYDPTNLFRSNHNIPPRQ